MNDTFPEHRDRRAGTEPEDNGEKAIKEKKELKYKDEKVTNKNRIKE